MSFLKYNYILFHNNCMDGFLSFVLLRESGLLTDNFYVKAIPPDIKTIPPNIRGKDIIIADLQLDISIFKNILREARSILFIEHHPGGETISKINDPKLTCFYAKDKCASRIIWENFFMKKNSKKKLPMLIMYIDDNDRMANMYEETSTFISAYEVHYNQESSKGATRDGYIERANKIAPLLKNNTEVKKLLKLGKHYSLYKYIITKKSANNFEGVDLIVPFSKKPWRILVSNIGGFCAKLVSSQFQMFDTFDLTITWYYNVSIKGITCICRSKTHNILWLLKMYGSNGHPRAGTFKIIGYTNIYDWVNYHNNRMMRGS